jgi:hypothetical protein
MKHPLYGIQGDPIIVAHRGGSEIDVGTLMTVSAGEKLFSPVVHAFYPDGCCPWNDYYSIIPVQS